MVGAARVWTGAGLAAVFWGTSISLPCCHGEHCGPKPVPTSCDISQLQIVPQRIYVQPGRSFVLDVIGWNLGDSICSMVDQDVQWSSVPDFKIPSGPAPLVSVPPEEDADLPDSLRIIASLPGAQADTATVLVMAPPANGAAKRGIWIGHKEGTRAVAVMLCADPPSTDAVPNADSVIAVAGDVLWNPPDASLCSPKSEVALFRQDLRPTFAQRADLEVQDPAKLPDPNTFPAFSIPVRLFASVAESDRANVRDFATQWVLAANQFFLRHRSGIRIHEVDPAGFQARIQDQDSLVEEEANGNCWTAGDTGPNADPAKWLKERWGVPESVSQKEIPVLILHNLYERNMGVACRTSDRRVAAVFIDARDNSGNAAILAHELGHVMGLNDPPLVGFGHAESPEFDQLNVMWTKFPTFLSARTEFAIGQSFFLNLEWTSWLAAHKPSGGPRDCGSGKEFCPSAWVDLRPKGPMP